MKTTRKTSKRTAAKTNRRPHELQLIDSDFEKAILAINRDPGNTSGVCPVSQAMKRVAKFRNPTTSNLRCYNGAGNYVDLTPDLTHARIYDSDGWIKVLASGQLPKFKLTWPKAAKPRRRQESPKAKGERETKKG